MEKINFVSNSFIFFFREYNLILQILILLFIVLFVVFKIIVYYKNVKLVKDCSVKYKALMELNRKYQFCRISQNNYISTKVKTLSTLQYFNIENKIIDEIISNKNLYSYLISAAEENGKKWISYQYDIDKLPPYMIELKSINIKISQRNFNKIEKKLINKSIFNEPVIQPDIIYRVSYTSPAGRKSYLKEWKISFHNLKYYFLQAEKKVEYKQSAKYERQRLSPSLRYEILKRDGFKCKLCGRSSSNGVELEVDHIIPVSKGGKTVKSNLRVLCKDCNRGKSDKFE